tara:strand:- start:3109 stop:3432 length:324 start_codon:yes stop_codon:yes gene_type:complete
MDYLEYPSGEKARKILMTTKDILFKNRKSVLVDWTGGIVETKEIDDDYVPCKQCRINIYPENCFGIEFANQETGWDWWLYDVYCTDCGKECWGDLPQKSYLRTSPLI